MSALDKMSKLGVTAALSPPSASGPCSPPRIGFGRMLSDEAEEVLMPHSDRRSLQVVETPQYLTKDDVGDLIETFGNNKAKADVRMRKIQNGRRDEIINLTTPVLF